MISVAIVTASRSLRLGWQTAVEKMPNAQCVGVYSTVAALLQKADGPPIQVVLLGVGARDRVAQLLEAIHDAQSQAKILVLASQLSDEQLFSALRAGAGGFPRLGWADVVWSRAYCQHRARSSAAGGTSQQGV